ncbi:MAG: hypothetical protein DI622_19520 [Chryseobacterium sp.]|nr:MAG: hypothetical protein DI622_19520 [Chryseobacterium sp.]
MKIKYYIIPFFFLSINILSQDSISIKEQCRTKYDSIFKNYFGEKFFRKNIKYDKSQSFIDIYLTNNIENDPEFKRIFLNVNNLSEIQKNIKQYPKYYSDYYIYVFLYKGIIFHERTYTCETVNKKEYFDYENKLILNYYNKIKNKEYISPKKALKIAKINGLKNICYQSLTSVSFHNKNQDVWQIQDCSNEITGKIIELDPKTGKVLTLFKRDYGQSGQAAYWNLFKNRK